MQSEKFAGASDDFHSALCTLHFAFEWSPRLVARQRLLVFSEALICLSYSGEMVVPAGNAPASSGYQPGALLLSYETSSSCGFTPKRRIGRKVTVGFAAGRMRMTRFGL